MKKTQHLTMLFVVLFLILLALPLQIVPVNGEVYAAVSTDESQMMTTSEIFNVNKNAVCKLVSFDCNGYPLGSGSGFLVSNDGEIITNYHVIKGAHLIEAEFAEEECITIKDVVAYDKDKDIAVLKLSETGEAHPVKFGRTADTKIGEKIIVIGSPLGYRNSISDGLISNRMIIDEKDYMLLSAPISPGSSGSPVFNNKGEVIGVVAAKILEAESLNVAIPLEEVLTVLNKKKEVISLKELTDLVYQEINSAEDLASYYMEKYNRVVYNKYCVEMNGIEVDPVSDRVMCVTVRIDCASYSDWLAIKELNSTVLSNWMEKVMTETKSRYPHMDFLGMIIYVQPVANYPMYAVTVPVYTLSDIAGFKLEKFH